MKNTKFNATPTPPPPVCGSPEAPTVIGTLHEIMSILNGALAHQDTALETLRGPAPAEPRASESAGSIDEALACVHSYALRVRDQASDLAGRL